MPSNRFAFLISATVFVLLTACRTRESERDEPSCCDAATPDAADPADALSDGPERERAEKLPPPTRRPLGAACAGTGDCDSNLCVDGVCCASACDATCYACNQAGLLGTCSGLDGVEDLSATTTCDGNRVCAAESSDSSSCKLREGEPCLASTECAGGTCRSYYTDQDGDGYGAAGSPAALSRCDANPNAPPGFSVNANDCCDSDPAASPSAVSFSRTLDRCGSYDWNCNGVDERQNAQSCPSAAGQPVACGQVCSIAFKGSVTTLYVQTCR